MLALDVGTSSTRAMLFDSTATAVPNGEVQLRYERRLKTDGTAEVDVEHLFAKVVESVDRVLERAQGRQIAAVGISTFWHGLLGASRSGSALTPLYLWSDSRSWRQAEELAREADSEQLRQLTGCPIHPTYWPAKLRWLRETAPELWERDPIWLSFGDLLSWRWFGAPETSISIASGTGLMALREIRWDQRPLELADIGEGSLPRIATGAKRLVSEFGARWSALAEARWQLPGGDGALASLGSDCTNVNTRAITIGTSGAMRVLSRDLPDALPSGLFCYRLDAETYVAGAASSNGGNVHEWLMNTLRLSDGVDEQIAAIQPGSHGLAVLPLLAGERSLGFASHATGAIAGLTLATRPEDIVCAGMEAIAIDFGKYSRRIDQAWPGAERLVASGGALLKSPVWMQMVADATAIPVEASAIDEASARGAALAALPGVDGWNAPARPEATRTFMPDPAAHEVYARLAEKQAALYELLVARRLLEAPGRTAHLVASID